MRCPACGNQEKVHRSHSIYFWERIVKLFSNYRLYRCHNCGWRGWLHQQTGNQLKRISLGQIFIFFMLGFLLGVLVTLWQQSRTKPECPQIPINCESNSKKEFKW
ncbi:MAG: hypothetical protein ACP5KG_12275 [Myxococcota bacterium]